MKKAGTVKMTWNKLLSGLGRALSLSLLVFSVCALCPAALRAEVPVKFTYQGNLRQSGFLVNGQRSMVFRIYASSTSSTELWTSPAYDIRVSTGVFRVTLEPVLSDWESGSLWLELEVAGNRMDPREELTSAPYAINSRMVSGKQYTTAPSSPTATLAGDLWYDSTANVVKFWNGSSWVDTSGGGIPGAHAASHSGGGADPIVSLGTHAVTGYVTVSSAVTAGWFSGDGSGLYNLDASKIAVGRLNGDRIGNVIVSTHIADGSISGQDIADGAVSRAKLNQSGCANGDVLQLSGGQWICGSGAAAGLETDPLSIHNQNVLQAGTTFYVSSGTVADLNVTNSFKVDGTTRFKGADTQNYSLAIGTGAVQQVVVSTSGAVGIGTEAPRARFEVTGEENSGRYIMIFNSGPKIAAWLRNK